MSVGKSTMNERIKELLAKATTRTNPEDRQWVFSKVDQEKFAELIVRECANYAFSNDQDHKAMLKHFGVEC